VTLTTHLHLVPRSWKSRSKPLLSLWARVACYRVKPNLTLHIWEGNNIYFVTCKPKYQKKKTRKVKQNATEEKNFEYILNPLDTLNYVVRKMLDAVQVWKCVLLSAV